jgi:hypothetical protein
MTQMILRFPIAEISRLSTQYLDQMGERDRGLTEAITQKVFPSYEGNGYLTREEFRTVCAWKSPRAKPRWESNDPTFIREVSSLARTTESERMRIQIWTLLAGVKWPTASVFLHFAFPGRYPILDFRALWSLGIDLPPPYTFSFWKNYTQFCLRLAAEAGVSMRELDQGLWKYSQLHQPKKTATCSVKRRGS